jgi:hypothetical protein
LLRALALINSRQAAFNELSHIKIEHLEIYQKFKVKKTATTFGTIQQCSDFLMSPI